MVTWTSRAFRGSAAALFAILARTFPGKQTNEILNGINATRCKHCELGFNVEECNNETRELQNLEEEREAAP